MFAPNPKPLDQRSTMEVIVIFFLLPIPAGVGILAMTVVNAAANGRQFTIADWVFQVGLAGVLGVGMLLALPAVGWEELQRRRRNGTLGDRQPADTERDE